MILGLPVWVTELAKRFWTHQEVVPFPRDLRATIGWLENLHCLEVPRLTLDDAIQRFHQLGIPAKHNGPNRPLAGCFAGYREMAVICVDSTLADSELRFTVAHELAHYLRDYLAPRERAKQRLGLRALEVLDGKRPATANERLAAIFRGVTLECHTHFLERDKWGNPTSEESHASEDAADWLAFELLAPCEHLVNDRYSTPESLFAALISKYGFSVHQAAKYVTILLT